MEYMNLIDFNFDFPTEDHLNKIEKYEINPNDVLIQGIVLPLNSNNIEFIKVENTSIGPMYIQSGSGSNLHNYIASSY